MPVLRDEIWENWGILQPGRDALQAMVMMMIALIGVMILMILIIVMMVTLNRFEQHWKTFYFSFRDRTLFRFALHDMISIYWKLKRPNVNKNLNENRDENRISNLVEQVQSKCSKQPNLIRGLQRTHCTSVPCLGRCISRNCFASLPQLLSVASSS